MRIANLLFFLFLFAESSAGDKKFPVSEIPDSLLKGADVVMRMDDNVFTISSLRSTTLKRHYAVTILNQNGDYFAQFNVDYDQLHSVENIEGYLYDSGGRLIKKLKKRDIEDVKAVSEVNFMDDSRLKTHNFYYPSYPYTVEYSYEVHYHHTFYFPSWTPIIADKEAIQSSSFTVHYPNNYKLRYHTLNFSKKPEENVKDNIHTLQWSIQNRPWLKIPERFASWRNVVPKVDIAPSRFELKGMAGNMTTWKDFGLFQYQLIKNRNQLPEAIRLKVHEITGSLQTKKEQIRALYHYLQDHTRYISIQLGIGGWQPFDARYVAANGYGDCKALTNFMYSLLMEAGIESYFTLVNAGRDAAARNRVIPDFPSLSFNHAILSIPLSNDTIWLECTSQTLPAGYMSAFTANRKALLIRPDGGYLVSTPRYGVHQNFQNRNINATISADGSARLNIQTTYSGTKQDFLFSMTNTLPPEKIKKYLSSTLSLPTFEITDFQYTAKDSTVPVMEEILDIETYNYATISGKRIFIVPNILTKFPYQLIKNADRKIDFRIEKAYSDSDHIEISLPDGYKIESGLKPVEIENDFGYYRVHATIINNLLIYERVFRQYRSVKPVSAQAEILAFYQKVYDTDRKRIVLVKEVQKM